jgi:hypothetical protein
VPTGASQTEETDHLCPKQKEGQTLSSSVPPGFLQTKSRQQIPIQLTTKFEQLLCVLHIIDQLRTG